MSEWSRRPIRRTEPATEPLPGAGRAPTVTAPPRPEPRSPADPLRRGPRRARLSLRKIDPWSVLKFAFVFALALAVVFLVAVVVVYLVLDTMGVFTSVDTTIRDLTASTTSSGLTNLFSFSRVVGGAAVLGAVNVVIITALATLGAFLYNVCADLVGGIEVTLTERD